MSHLTTTKFLIAALPRSGTLWLSNYLCACGLPTVHEYSVSSGYDGWDGACGSDCIDNHDQLINELPAAKWIIVERPVEECINSFSRNFPGISRGEIAEYFRSLRQKLNSIQGLRIQFSELFSQRSLEALADYLGFKHDAAIAEQFIISKIELHSNYLNKWESQQH